MRNAPIPWNEIGPSQVLNTDAYAPLVRLPGSDFYVPRRFYATFDHPRLPFDLHLEVVVSEKDGPVCVELQVRQRFDGKPVTQDGLRTLSVVRLVHLSTQWITYSREEYSDGTIAFVLVAPSEMLSELPDVSTGGRPGPPSEETLRYVGDLVKEHLADSVERGAAPQVYAFVKKRLAVSRSTAQRRIEEAQRRGFAPRWVDKEAGK